MLDGETQIPIELNGERRTVAAGMTLSELIQELELRPELLAVEINRTLVPRAERAARALASGDQIEFVTLVGGG